MYWVLVLKTKNMTTFKTWKEIHQKSIKKNILLLVLCPTFLLAQTRNDKVHELNTIVDFMSVYDDLNVEYLRDVMHLARAFYECKDEVNDNYFSSSRTQARKNFIISYTGFEEDLKFKEVQPNDGKSLRIYQSEIIPFLKAREKVKLLLGKKKFISNYGIESNLNTYLKTIDSLLYYHKQLDNYVLDKTYKTDEKFKVGKQILRFSEQYYNDLLQNSDALFASIKNYYTKELPLNATLAALQNGQKELLLTIDLLDEWKTKLLAGDNTQNDFFDQKIRSLNVIGLSKVDAFFTKTYGAQYSMSNGWFVQTRYIAFYQKMEGTIFHYANQQQGNIPYLDPIKQTYNTFSLSYNHMIESYNHFIQLADGKTMKEESDGESPMKYNNNANIMLKYACLPRLFGYVETENTDVVKPQTQKTNFDIATQAKDQNRINKALPHHLVYLLDTSNSMNIDDKMALVKSNAKYLLGLQRETDKLSILIFADKTKVLLENKSCNLKEEIGQTIDNLKAKGGTNIDQGIEYAIQMATQNKLQEGKNKILLFTDGAFSISLKTEQLLLALQSQQINFSIVYLGNAMTKGNTKNFESLCERTKITYYDINKTNLKEILIKEATE
jgi:von Willebrand factor type A domain